MAASEPLKLGRYEIVKELGRGAMGVVYLGWDPLIGRQVALKTLRAAQALAGSELEQFRHRFLREAQSAGILSHPHIVTVHDVVDESPEGQIFIAMEHVEGTNLKELLRGGQPLDLNLAADLLEQVADALSYAHARGVVHRDVKPANILITAEGKVKITDFGIARLTASNLTQDTQLLGTPNYMAPEQIQGRAVDHRSDVFSLGVVLYEMITGRKPFSGENLTEVTHRIVYDELSPPSRQARDLPAAADEVLGRALEKEPRRRYSSARELASAFRQAVEAHHDPNDTQAVPPLLDGAGWRGWLSYHGRQAWDGGRALAAVFSRTLSARPPRNRLLTAAGIALVATLLVSSLAFVWVSPKEKEDAEATESSLAARLRYLELVREGHRLLRSGDAVAAAGLFRRAERLAPERLAIRRMREAAEQAALTGERLNEIEQGLERKLSEAQNALSARRYRQAADTALTILELAPDNAEAKEILAAARQGQRLAEQRLAESRRQEEVVAPPVTEPPPPPSPAPEPLEVVPATGPPTLEIEFVSFYTREPVGTLSVWVGREQLLQYGYRFRERKGPLGILGSEAYAGRVENPPRPLPEGEHEIRIYVTPKGKAALAKILSGRFAAGDHRKLDIHLSEEGDLTARLR